MTALPRGSKHAANGTLSFRKGFNRPPAILLRDVPGYNVMGSAPAVLLPCRIGIAANVAVAPVRRTARTHHTARPCQAGPSGLRPSGKTRRNAYREKDG